MLPMMRAAIAAQPDCILLCAGANDVGARHYNRAETVADIRRMIDLAHASGIRVVLTLVPQRARHADEIDRLNAELVALAADAIIDLNPELAPTGALADAYTTDGVHFTPSAYGIWGQKLRGAVHQ